MRRRTIDREVGLSGRFPYLRPGDVVEVEVEGLGRQRHTIGSMR